MIPYGRQSIDEGDIAAVVDVLRGAWLTQGPAVPRFEEAVAAKVGAKSAVAFSSGTAALHGAMLAADIGPGDLVQTSPLTFVASANCARYVGASVGLVDIDASTLLMNTEKIDPSAAAVIPVHYAGLPVDLRTLPVRPRVVVEDAAHALGATTPDGPVGNCAHSDMAMFSFHPVKHITTGEGGIITTNDEGLADELRRARNHGIVHTPELGGWSYDVVSTGFNFRMTDVQAALGHSQLGKLDSFVARRNELAENYREALADLPLELPPPAGEGFTHAYHLFPIRVANRRRIYDQLRAVGIGVQVHYVPVHHHSSYSHLGQDGELPAADAAYDRLLSLPLFPSMSQCQLNTVVRELERALA